MPIRLTIEKSYQNETWTNVYWLGFPDIAAAEPSAAQIVQAEKNILLTPCVLTKYRLDDGIPNTDNYGTYVVNAQGLQALGGSQMLPLFAVARVDFQVTGSRPSRKYLRGCATEGNLNGPFDWAADWMQGITTSYVAVCAQVPSYVDVDGQNIEVGAVHPRVANRQLRRGSKKKNTP